MSDKAYISTTHRVIKMDGGEGDAPCGFGEGDRMSTPCFIHLKEKCPMSETYGSAEHYLRARLVTLGVVPPAVLQAELQPGAFDNLPWEDRDVDVFYVGAPSSLSRRWGLLCPCSI